MLVYLDCKQVNKICDIFWSSASETETKYILMALIFLFSLHICILELLQIFVSKNDAEFPVEM
jgi:hypothetical protein